MSSVSSAEPVVQAREGLRHYCDVCGRPGALRRLELFSAPVIAERVHGAPAKAGPVRGLRERTYDLAAVRLHRVDVCTPCARRWREPARLAATVAGLGAGTATLALWLAEATLNGLGLIHGLLPLSVHLAGAVAVFALGFAAGVALLARPSREHARAEAERILSQHSAHPLRFGWAADYPAWRQGLTGPAARRDGRLRPPTPRPASRRADSEAA